MESFDPLGVTLKRDNDVGFLKTEFYDDLGNGLYLDTDLDEYEERVTGILEDCMVPDYNSLMMKECTLGNLKGALVLVDEMIRWGQDLSLSMISALLRGLSASHSHTKAITSIVDSKLHLVHQLDQEALNLLAQAYIKKGLAYNARIVLNGMIERHLKMKNETYTSLVKGFCKKGNSRELHAYWNIAQNDRWLPGPEDCKALIECLCNKEMLREAVQLLESILISYPHLRPDICHMFVDKLFVSGFTRIASVLLDELEQRGGVLDQMAYTHLIRGLCKEKNFPFYAAFSWHSMRPWSLVRLAWEAEFKDRLAGDWKTVFVQKPITEDTMDAILTNAVSWRKERKTSGLD